MASRSTGRSILNIFALHGYNKNRIKEYIENQFAYNLSLDDMRKYNLLISLR